MGLPGAARQPLTFLVSPRKVSKRRRPQGTAPSGSPTGQYEKWETGETRFAQTAPVSFSIFRIAQSAAPQRKLPGRLAFGIAILNMQTTFQFLASPDAASEDWRLSPLETLPRRAMVRRIRAQT